MRLLLVMLKLSLLALTGAGWAAAKARERGPKGRVDFVKDIKPILEQRCLKCHGPQTPQSGLRVNTREGLLQGGKGGKVVVPGSAEGSRLYKLITLPEDDPLRMPNEGEPLTKDEIAKIREWIHGGIRWPRGVILKTAAPASGEIAAAAPTEVGFPITEAEKSAVAKLEQAGVLTLRLAQNVNWLRVDFSRRGKEVKDSELALLKDIPNLIELSLGGTDLTDTGLTHLKTLRGLTRLHLQNTKITDAGLVNLRGLEKLTWLNIHGTTVSDNGLEHLSGLKNMRDLFVWQTKVSRDGAMKLAAMIPDLTIILGNGAPPIRQPKTR